MRLYALSELYCLRPSTRVANGILTPSYKLSFIKEPVDIYFKTKSIRAKCPGKEIFKATTQGPRNKILPGLVAFMSPKKGNTVGKFSKFPSQIIYKFNHIL